MKVNISFNDKNKKSMIVGGWKRFRKNYNLQVDDDCKFVMTQRRPPSFDVIINRARKGPSPTNLRGFSFFLYYLHFCSCYNFLKILISLTSILLKFFDHGTHIKKGSLVMIILQRGETLEKLLGAVQECILLRVFF
jgi:hypothetical protein